MALRKFARSGSRSQKLGVYVVGAAIISALVTVSFSVAGLSEILSAIILVTISFICCQIHQLRREPGRSALAGASRIWLLMALGFAYLALDEALSFHEGIDQLIHTLFAIKETRLTDRIDDLIVLLYGIVGAIVLFLHRVEFRSFTGFLHLFVLGFLLLLLMVVLDLATNRKDILIGIGVPRSWVPSARHWLEVGEEVAKLLAETVFLLGFVRIRQQSEADSRRRTTAPQRRAPTPAAHRWVPWLSQ
ncbi:MAG: hypothetical protein KDK07_01670 [Bauldia sp.]|nr:hypothetical protein [Bauldia sp.]